MGYVDPIRADVGDARATALHPPLWSAVLAVPSALGLDSELAHRLVGCVLGALTVALVGWCGRLLAGARVGLVAAAIAAFHPTLLAADGSLHAETVFGLCASAALLCALIAARDGNTSAAAAAGAGAALAALARGEGLVLGIMLAAALATWFSGRDRWRMPLALLATMMLLIVPWTIRNQVQMGEPVLLSTNDSTVLAGANCDPTYYGSDIGTWHLECIRGVPFESTEVERSAIWREEAIDYGLDHLTRTPVVAASRFLRIWGVWDPGGQELVEGRSPGLQQVGIWVHAFVILPLAVGGLWLARKRFVLPVRLAAAPLLTVAVTGVLAFGTLRFRHGAEAMLAILAATALVAAAERNLSAKLSARSSGPLRHERSDRPEVVSSASSQAARRGTSSQPPQES